jgi:hypothetical protein
MKLVHIRVFPPSRKTPPAAQAVRGAAASMPWRKVA